MASRKGEVQLILGFLTISATVLCSLASEQFIVTHAPSYLHYSKNGGKLPISEIPQLVKSTYGFSLRKDLSFHGLVSDSLLKRPKANVIFSVTGLGAAKEISIPHVADYNTHSDDEHIWTDIVAHSLLSTAESPLVVDFSRKTMFDVQVEHPELFREISPSLEAQEHEISLSGYQLGTLNATQAADAVLLTEINLVKQIIEALKRNPTLVKDNAPDLLHFRFGGLKEVLIRYGADSQKSVDSIQLIQEFIHTMTQELKTLYNENVIVQIVTLPMSVSPRLIRKTRSLLQDGAPPSWADRHNLADPVDEQYSVIFNIILWMSLLIGLTVIAVSLGMWNMDPGRDSIIYRMTSQRMKKD